MHVIAAKAVAFKEALTPEFKKYQEQIIKNAKTLGETLKEEGLKLVSGGTDTHLVLVDLSGMEVTGKDVENALGLAEITVNKNTVPFETRSPFITSGVRIGTPAVTTRGMKEKEMVIIGKMIANVIHNISNEAVIKQTGKEVRAALRGVPLVQGRYFLGISPFMMKRRKSRELAFKLFYALELSGDSRASVLERFSAVTDPEEKDVKEYALSLFNWATEMTEELNTVMPDIISNWSMARVSKVDKSLIYLACAEIKKGGVPVNVVMNEYIELAKAFGDKDAPSFVNGVVDLWYKRA